jgi:hypothetical protein
MKRKAVAVARRCASCGERYYRRNVTEVWRTRQVEGRAVWRKTRVPLCTHCVKPAQAEQMLLVTGVRITARMGNGRAALAAARGEGKK